MILWQMFSYSKKLGLSSTAIEIQDRRKMYLTLVIAVIQSLVVSLSLPVQSSYSAILVVLMNTLLLIAGAFFLIWLSDLNASMGIGGSIVILISSIVLNIPQDVIETFQTVHIPIGIIVLLALLTVVFSYLLAIMYRARYLVLLIKLAYTIVLNAILISNHAESCWWNALYVCDELPECTSLSVHFVGIYFP